MLNVQDFPFLEGTPDLAAAGIFEVKGIDMRQLTGQLAAIVAAEMELRGYVYQLLKGEGVVRGLVLLARAVAETPDVEGLVLLIKLEGQLERELLSWRTVESLVTEHIPLDGAGGAYNVASIPAIELRRSLLDLVTDGGPADASARCLRHIDELRDEYGIPDAEPRHPNLASGKRWPILV